MAMIVVCLSLLVLVGTPSALGAVAPLRVEFHQPRHVHLSYGETPLDIVVTWSTLKETGDSVVEFGDAGGLDSVAVGGATKFVDDGPKKRVQFIHRVTLPRLKPNTQYRYHCGNMKHGWSSTFTFRTNQLDAKWSPRLAIYGDMGNENAQSIPRLQEDVAQNRYDAILHVGDFAYDMNWENGQVGDEFMNQIEPIAAYLPYMVVPGNHEQANNFSHYKARFTMPGRTQNMFYSFDLGPVHFVGFSTEYYYNLNYGLKSVVEQYQWLKRDLEQANANRAKRPWIVTFGHRPMYCSTADGDDCTKPNASVRVGLPLLHIFGLEDLFFRNGVDLEIWAHEHTYERLWPLYDFKVLNGSAQQPYTNPGAPVHIITGSAGCRERVDSFLPKPKWSAFRSSDYGYTRMQAHNATHLHLEQVSDDKDGQIIDSIWIVKEKHGKYE